MDFCVISPITGLERYSVLSTTHLLLAQINDSNYWAFYINRRKAGDFIILDNGAYEGELNRSTLLDRIKLVKPQVVALPDRLGEDWKASSYSSFHFLESYYHEFPKVQWMYIPQAEPGDIIGFVESLFRALDDERISYIGLPRALSYSITSDLAMRVRMAEQIRKRDSRVKIHALGMVKGSVLELKQLASLGCVASIDSNAPVWRGWCGYSLSDKWSETPVDYANTWSPAAGGARDLQILSNLKECGIDGDIYLGSGSGT